MYPVIRESRPSGFVIKQNKDETTGLEYLTFPNLEKTGIVKHLFSTRLGGVSEGIYSSMNLSFTRGDKPECVEENYKRIASVLDVATDCFVCTDQTHTTNIRIITDKDRGKGVTKPRDYTDIDGLITNIPGMVLTTLYADCVPLYFVDPVQKVIGLAHSGWRGTIQGIGKEMIKMMEESYGCCPNDIQAAIGPSICQSCYEVSRDVAEQFQEVFGSADLFLEELEKSGTYRQKPQLVKPGNTELNFREINFGEKNFQEDKYQLDLWLANWLVMRQAGIPLSNIAVTDICTCHNESYLFSHRASQGKRGNLAAFLMLINS